jgi:tetratricopeptide (TPR) repeat protein
MHRLRKAHLLLGLVLAVAPTSAGSVAAQSRADRAPKRPVLPVGRDSNSARDYFYYGASQLDKHPEQAAAAFYWASRIDPTWADPLYGEYIALLLTQPTHVLTGYLTRDRKILRDSQILQIDSLAYEALLRNPFVDRRFDATLIQNWLYRLSDGTVTILDLDTSNPRLAAWLAYSYGRFAVAVTRYATALRQDPDDPTLQLERALPFVALGLNDSALAAVRASLAIYRGSDTARAAYMYESHAFAEYQLATLFERGQQPDSARAAYERALLDDITFHPAHRRLAGLCLAAGDTAGALREYTDATALDPGDATALFEFGAVTMAAGHPDSAVTLLRQASTAEPYYARPHYALGVIYERSGFVEEAVEEYGSFLRLVPSSMTAEIEAVRRRIEVLHGSPSKP